MTMQMKPGCCGDDKTLGDTIQKAVGHLCTGHLGVASLYDSLAGRATPEAAKKFMAAAKKHRDLVELIKNDVVIPEV